MSVNKERPTYPTKENKKDHRNPENGSSEPDEFWEFAKPQSEDLRLRGSSVHLLLKGNMYVLCNMKYVLISL